MVIQKKGLFKAVLIKLLIVTLYTLSNNPKYLNIFYGIGAIFIFVEIFDKLYVKNRLIITFHTKATFIFFLICTTSIFWSIEPAFDYYKFLVFNFFLMFALNNYVDNREKLDEVFKALVYAGLAMALHVLIVSRGNFASSQRLFVEGYNANTIGLYLSFSLLASVYFFDRRRNFNYLIPPAIFIVVIFLTGSKKALFLLVFLIAFYLIFKRKGVTKKIKNTIFAISLIGLISYLVFTIPWAYEIMGTRVLELINSITSGGPGQDDIRFYMIESGVESFKQKPIIGYGLGNYRVLLNDSIGWYTYSHNNFIELLVSVGIIGFLSYYTIYFYTIKRLIKNYKKDVNLVAFLLAIILGLLIMEVGLVSFYRTFYQLIITLSFIGLRITNCIEDRNTWVIKKQIGGLVF